MKLSGLVLGQLFPLSEKIMQIHKVSNSISQRFSYNSSVFFCLFLITCFSNDDHVFQKKAPYEVLSWLLWFCSFYVSCSLCFVQLDTCYPPSLFYQLQNTILLNVSAQILHRQNFCQEKLYVSFSCQFHYVFLQQERHHSLLEILCMSWKLKPCTYCKY